MARINFRIGTKLGLTAGVGVLLVAGMLTNQLQGNQSIGQSSRLVVVNTSNRANAQTAEAAIGRAQLAALEVSIALSTDKLDKSHEAMRASLAEAGVEIEAAAQRATRPQVKELYREIRTFIDALQTVGNELATARRADLATMQLRNQTAEAWARTFDPLLALPNLAASPNHFSIDLNLREAGVALNAARAAGWRYATTAEHAQRELIFSNSDLVLAALTRARPLANEKDILAGIDGLLAVAHRFKAVAQDAVKAEETNLRVLNDSVIPAGKEVSTRIAKAVGIANEFSARRQSELVAELDSVGKIAVGVGALVVLMLLGSALFSVMNIARPIRRIGDVLLELASGNKAVDVPYATRGDEVGDAARAAKTFRENLIRMEQMESEQKDEEVATAARRRADMIKLADAFQAAVGGIVDTVSTASGALEAAAGTLSGTADETQQLSGMVASASEEASANVESVAAATEEMSTSVTEIGRRVHDSSRIAGEAVLQAERTDARINELSEAADRIGHVVRLITAIAEQTNLLALNATIEAARAGESGRGFAVVASEVKALAAQTAKATDEISVQITGMQAATKESVGAIKEISSTISRIAEIASTIAATVEEQGAATAEIARNVNEAARGTAQVAEKITQVNRGANATGTASAQVLASARSLSKESGSLKSEVENFLQTVRAA